MDQDLLRVVSSLGKASAIRGKPDDPAATIKPDCNDTIAATFDTQACTDDTRQEVGDVLLHFAQLVVEPKYEAYVFQA